MSDSLHPLRQVYGLDDRPPEGGAAVEGELLRQMRRLLEAAPPVRPEPATVAAVEAAAAQAGEHGALRSLLDGTADGIADNVEAELISQSLSALDTLPTAAPNASTLDAIFAAAAQASAPLAPIRSAYGLGNAASQSGDAVEATLLSQMRAALDAARREHRPEAASVEAVLAHAAAATTAQNDAVPMTATPSLAALYGASYDASGADGGSPVEVAVMRGADAALDRLPVQRPADASVAAILAAAAAATSDAQSVATASAPAATPAVPLGGARRIASPAATAAPAALWARPAVWGSAAAMLAAVVIVVNLFGSEPTALPEVAAFADEVPQIAANETVEAEPTPSAALPPPPPAPEPSPISAGAAALAAGGPMAGVPQTASPFQPRAVLGAPPVRSASPVRTAPRPSASRGSLERQTMPVAQAPAPQSVRAQAPPAPAPAAFRAAPRRDVAAEADLIPSALAAAPADDASAKTSESWDAGEDVRLLSLRLQELRRQNQGLGWDDAEAFGAPAVGAASAMPGVQTVGMGRMSGVPAARARAIVDTTQKRR